MLKNKNATLAQLVEHSFRKAGVPVRSREVAQKRFGMARDLWRLTRKGGFDRLSLVRIGWRLEAVCEKLTTARSN